jgi:hypothetical protein
MSNQRFEVFARAGHNDVRCAETQSWLYRQLFGNATLPDSHKPTTLDRIPRLSNCGRHRTIRRVACGESMRRTQCPASGADLVHFGDFAKARGSGCL